MQQVWTINEAEYKGFDGLEVSCTCHHTQIPWPMLRRLPFSDLEDIAVRLKCSTCGKAPYLVRPFKRKGRMGGHDMEYGVEIRCLGVKPAAG